MEGTRQWSWRVGHVAAAGGTRQWRWRDTVHVAGPVIRNDEMFFFTEFFFKLEAGYDCGKLNNSNS